MLEKSTTGVDQNATDIMLYPNPFDSFIIINSDKEISSVTVTNIFGQLIVQTGRKSKIQTSTFSPGVYFVTVEDINGDKSVFKMLKK